MQPVNRTHVYRVDSKSLKAVNWIFLVVLMLTIGVWSGVWYEHQVQDPFGWMPNHHPESRDFLMSLSFTLTGVSLGLVIMMRMFRATMLTLSPDAIMLQGYGKTCRIRLNDIEGRCKPTEKKQVCWAVIVSRSRPETSFAVPLFLPLDGHYAMWLRSLPNLDPTTIEPLAPSRQENRP